MVQCPHCGSIFKWMTPTHLAKHGLTPADYLETRFWSKVKKTSSCWEWMAAKYPAGYGKFQMGDKNIQAHRIAYEMLRGPIPDGKCIDHLCRNRGCVNPDHMELVT